MRSSYGIVFMAIVGVMLVSSCSLLMKSGDKAQYIYGEGYSPEMKSIQLARRMAEGNSRTDIARQVIDRYNQYYLIFMAQTNLPENSTGVNQFEKILKQFSPKKNTIEISLVGTNVIDEDIKKANDLYKVKVKSRMHIGSANMVLLEIMKQYDDLYNELTKTNLYDKMQNQVNHYQSLLK